MRKSGWFVNELVPWIGTRILTRIRHPAICDSYERGTSKEESPGELDITEHV